MDAFVEAFYEKYFPESVRHKKEVKFLTLDHESLSMAAYGAKFTELAHLALYIVIDEPTRASKFL